jgi:hypothetical protein
MMTSHVRACIEIAPGSDLIGPVAYGLANSL